MSNKTNVNKLIIDSDFENITPKMTDEELRYLEDNLVSDGEILSPIVVWNDIVLDGINEFKILKKHPNLKYHCVDKRFCNRYEALAWAYKNILAKPGLTPLQRTAIIGRQYQAEKFSWGSKDRFRGNQYIKNITNCDGRKTSEVISERFGVSPQTVLRAGRFIDGLDQAEAISPGISTEILSDRIRPSRSIVISITEADADEKERIVNYILKGLR